ncbi:MAG: CBS domain-containing protein, partial [Candidatus Omnitrophica bacterium]|nr:CBS domain-containing protein [Candidatus Omnitrophota bacterium]
VMTRHPKTIGADHLAAEALQILREQRIDELVVVDGQRPVGLLDVQDLLKAGFV